MRNKYMSDTRTFREGDFVWWHVNSLKYRSYDLDIIQRKTIAHREDTAGVVTVTGTGKIIDSSYPFCDRQGNLEFLRCHSWHNIIPDEDKIVDKSARYYLIEARNGCRFWIIASLMEEVDDNNYYTDIARIACLFPEMDLDSAKDHEDELLMEITRHEYYLWKTDNDFAPVDSPDAKFDIEQDVVWKCNNTEYLQVELRPVNYQNIFSPLRYDSKTGQIVRRIWYEHPFSEDEIDGSWWEEDTQGCDSFCYKSNCDCYDLTPEAVVENYHYRFIGWVYAVIMSFHGNPVMIYAPEHLLEKTEETNYDLSINDLYNEPILVDENYEIALIEYGDILIDGIFCQPLTLDSFAEDGLVVHPQIKNIVDEENE